MALADLLAQLRETFPAGSASGTFDAGRVDGGRFAPLLADLGVPVVLALTSPAGWLADGDQVRLTGRTQTPVLGLTDAGIYLRFTPSGAGPDDYVLLIDVSLPGGWTFGTSFAALNAGVMAELAVADPEASRRSALLIASAPVTHGGRIVDGSALAIPAGLS